MTETEWLACKDPRPMLEFLRGKASERKLRLFACACVRRVWHLLDDQSSREAVEAGERRPDGPRKAWRALFERAHHAAGMLNIRAHRERRAPGGKAAQARAAAASAAVGILQGSAVYNYASAGHLAAIGASYRAAEAAKFAARAAGAAGRPGAKTERIAQSKLVRDVFGNPFHPVTVDPAWLAWQGGTVRKLAGDADEGRRLPEGTLEATRVAVLADALEDAGCADAELLGHLRGPEPHVRGCWAVDLLLGKD
jgi:hypothetical protein